MWTLHLVPFQIYSEVEILCARVEGRNEADNGNASLWEFTNYGK